MVRNNSDSSRTPLTIPNQAESKLQHLGQFAHRLESQEVPLLKRIGMPRIGGSSLTEKASIEFTDDVMDFIGKLNNASVVTRYPQNLSELKASYPKKVAEEYLKETKKVARWLKKDPRLSE